MLWVQQPKQETTGASTVRTWHLDGALGETRCGLATRLLKALPKAAWDQVLNPCTHCQLNADLPGVAARPAPELPDAPGVSAAEHRVGRHASRE